MGSLQHIQRIVYRLLCSSFLRSTRSIHHRMGASQTLRSYCRSPYSLSMSSPSCTGDSTLPCTRSLIAPLGFYWARLSGGLRRTHMLLSTLGYENPDLLVSQYKLYSYTPAKAHRYCISQLQSQRLQFLFASSWSIGILSQ